ncbi:MAG: Gfo/Idh/MocA family oxidoreductase [Gemmatimonadota bacterium]
MNRESRPLSVGLIGFGLAGASFHAPLIAATPGLRLAAVVTRDPARRQQAERERPGAQVLDTADELFAGHLALDLIVIASPNRTHVALAEAALAAGLHVVVDKPLARNAAEARALEAAAARSGRMLTVFHNRRWDGDFLTLRRLLENDDLGKPLRFESRFERWRPLPKPGWRESGSVEEAGGVLYDLGSHLIDQALVLFGPVRHVYAELQRRRPGVQVDDDAFVALTHATGVQSHLYASMLAAQPGPRMRMLGTRAAFTKYGMDVQEAALRAGVQPHTRGWGEESAEAWGKIGADGADRPVRTEAGDYPRFYAAVVESLQTGALPPVDPHDAIAGLEIIEAAHRSAAEHRTIAIN